MPVQLIALFDGTCGFCTWSVLHLRRLAGGKIAFAPYQWIPEPNLQRWGITREACSGAIHFVLDGAVPNVCAGADAINEIVVRTQYRRVALFVLDRDWLWKMERTAYSVIARHRVLISRILGTHKFALIDDDTYS